MPKVKAMKVELGISPERCPLKKLWCKSGVTRLIAVCVHYHGFEGDSVECSAPQTINLDVKGKRR